MIAIEVIHHMKISKKVRDKNVALKLDISKAYDRIDWLYLKEVVIKMGFASRWIRWIMTCVETIDYSVIVNNESVGPIILGRGLKQGDPLSPTCLFYVQKVSQLSFVKLKGEGIFMTFL